MIIVRLKGGLGNQMFEYAAGRALALKTGSELLLDATFLNDRTPRKHFTFRSYELGIFNIHTRFTFLSRLSFMISIPLLWPTLSVLSARLRMIFSKDFRYLSGYFQNEMYFKQFESEIRDDLSPRDPLSSEAKKITESIQTSESVSVHVRRGDYVSDSKTAEVHGFLGVEYYENAANFIAGKVNNPHFFVFSDDLEWCRNNMNINRPVHYVSCGVNDLHLMSLCKHNIIANSTFSWWGAWLNKNPRKIVVAPKRWFAGSDHDSEDIVPKNWVRM